MKRENTNNATSETSAGPESLVQPSPSPRSEQEVAALAKFDEWCARDNIYVEVPEPNLTPRQRYNITRRLFLMEDVLELPPISIRWVVDGGNTGKKLSAAVWLAMKLWGCDADTVFEKYLITTARSITLFGETYADEGDTLAFTHRDALDTIWVRAEGWLWDSSGLSIVDTVTHECRHLWQYRHLDDDILANNDALEYDAYHYQEYCVLVAEGLRGLRSGRGANLDGNPRDSLRRTADIMRVAYLVPGEDGFTRLTSEGTDWHRNISAFKAARAAAAAEIESAEREAAS